MDKDQGKANSKEMMVEPLETEKKEVDVFKVKQGMVFFYVFTVAMSSFQFGYISFLINPLIQSLPVMHNWDQGSIKLNIALLSTGPALGSLFGSFLSKQILSFGRLKAIHIQNGVMVIGSLFTLTGNLHIMILGRVLQGFSGIGLSHSMTLKIVYEIAPVPMRSICGAFNNLISFTGFFVLMATGFWNPLTEDDQKESQFWRLVFAVPLLVCLLQTLLIVIFFNHETPLYLLLENKDLVRVQRVYRKIYETSDVQSVIEYFRQTNQQTGTNKVQVNFKDALFHPMHRGQTWVSIFIYSVRISVGNNILNLYSTMIFALSGIQPQAASFISASASLLGCIFSMCVSKIFGRRTLMAAGFGILSLLHITIILGSILNINFLITIAAPLFSLVFNSTLSICFTYLSDIGTEASLALSATFLSLCILANSFITPFMLMSSEIGVPGTFLMLSVISSSGFLFSIFVIKETKGLTDDQCKTLYAKKTQPADF